MRLPWPGLLVAVACLPSLALAREAPVDHVVEGRVWTGHARRPWAEAVAIRGERIAYVGSAAGAAELRGPETRISRHPEGLVLPGFNDSHIHLFSGAAALDWVDLIEEQTLAAVQERIRAFAAEHPDRDWVLGRGWLYGAFPGGLPTRAQLDAVVPDRPAFMECYDGHSAWVNTKALEIAGITRDTPDPERGEIVRDPGTGEPTGALKESAVGLVQSKIPPPSAEQRYDQLVRACRLLSSQGITSLQDAGYDAATFAREELPLLLRARRDGALTVRSRISIVLDPEAPEAGIAEAKRLAALHHDALLQLGAVKAFADGVIEARTAAMLDPYPGEGGRGLPNWEPRSLADAVIAADREGLQVYIHAIGDRAVRMALDAHEAALRENGPRDRRGRIEHVETIHPDDDPRFRELGVIAAMQPLHADPVANIFEVWAPNAGPERAGRGFGWASLERAGARLAFGSDWPVVTSDVRRGLYCAVTRRTRRGRPPGGWLPEQAVELESALRHYTSDGAWASFDEDEKGTLEVGKLADVVVLSRDVTRAPAEAILDAEIVLTLVGGRIVYERAEPGR